MAYEFAATATLKTGAACADTLEVKGLLGVDGPQSGGIGLAPWVLSSEPEREALERATHERAEREARERAEREARERAEHERQELEAKEHAEEQRIRTALARLVPTGRSRSLTRLLKTGSWTTFFDAPGPGSLDVSWYEVPKGVHITRGRRTVLIARGRRTFDASGTGKLTVRLTREGRQLLKHATQMKLDERGYLHSGRKAATGVGERLRVEAQELNHLHRVCISQDVHADSVCAVIKL